MDVVLLTVAGLFAVFCGANDGGALLSTSLRMVSVRPLTAAFGLSGMVAVAPAVLGTQVATTLADRLVSFSGEGGQAGLLIAVVSATVMVAALSWRGVPTSLTVALIGGIIGVGIGANLPIAWGWVGFVLLLAVVAPLAGTGCAFGLTRLWGVAHRRGQVGAHLGRAHRLGLVLQGVAYGSNDGQKMVAVFALAVPAGVGTDRAMGHPWILLTVSVLFLLGMLLGVRRYGSRLGSGVLRVSPVNAVTAQLASGIAVTGSAVAGAPVSMTQAITGALVGSGLTQGSGRIRWSQVAGIAAAWLLTLPAAMLMATLVAAMVVRS